MRRFPGERRKPRLERSDGALGCGRSFQSRACSGYTMEVPFVIVGHSGRNSRPHWQDRLGAVQRLDLRLLVHAQNQRFFRRIQVQPHRVGHLARELRIATEFEGFNPMRLQTPLLPDAMNRAATHPELFRQRPYAPVRGSPRRPHRRGDDPRLIGRRDRRRAARPLRRLKTAEPLAPIPIAPPANADDRHLEPPRK